MLANRPIRWTLMFSVGCLLLATAGCGSNGQGSESEGDSNSTSSQNSGASDATGVGDGASGEAGPTREITFVGLTGPAPESWREETPQGTMRKAQLAVPGVDGAGDASVVVFNFGPGQGGAVELNIQRWTGQFSDPDGGALVPRIDQFNAGDLAIVRFELSGTYNGGAMGGGIQSNQTMIQAIVEGPAGKTFVRLLGPKETVAAHAKAFDQLLRGLTVDNGA